MDEALPEGGWKLSFRMLSVELDSTMAAAAPEMSEEFARMQGTMKMRPDGRVYDTDFIMPSDVDAPVQDVMKDLVPSMEGLSQTLPGVPVGLGARWTSADTVKTGVFDLLARSTYELEEMDEAGGRIRSEVRMTAPPQKIRVPEMPSTAEATIDSLDGTAEGYMRIQVDMPNPVEGASRSHQVFHMRVSSDQFSMTMRQEMTMTTSIRTVASGSSQPPVPRRP